MESWLAVLVAVAGVVASAHPAGAAPTTTSTTVSPPTTLLAPGVPEPVGFDAPLPMAPPPPGYPMPVPPPKGTPLPPSLDWLTAAHTNGSSVHAEHGAIEQLTNAKTVLQHARDAANAAHRKLDALQLRINDEHDTLKRIERTRAEIVARQKQRAVNVYMSGSGGVIIDSLVAAPTVDDGRRSVYAEAAQTVDAASIDQADKQYRAEQAALEGLEAQAGVARGQVIAANQRLGVAFGAFAQLSAALNDASHGGRVFPVDGKYEFDDSWGFYRAAVYAGTTSHGHHATDIMSPLGTPIVAIESGTLDRVGWNRLGGWRLWIKGFSGTNYYYAHMSAYAPGLHQGTLVLAGQYLGRVGNTGDAQGGPTHLHIEVHVATPTAYRTTDPSKDGWAVNPYPLLCLLAGAPVPQIPPNDPISPVTTSTTSTTASTSTTTSTLPKRP